MASLGVSWSEAGHVVVSAVGIYLAFLVLLRIVGQRALASMSSFDFAAAVAVGAVMGRSLLGYTPTLLAGVVGLTTLFALQTAFGLLRRTPRLQALMSNPPVVLLRDGRVLHANLRAAHLIEDELREKLRLHGIRSYDEVACAVLERTGALSVLRAGEPISPELLADVKGWAADGR